MEFRTAITPPPLATRITHAAPGLALGSCFAGNIAGRLLKAKFPVVENPFGVLYNPASIARAIGMLAAGRRFTEADLEYDGSLWYSFAHHGGFSAPDPHEALAAMNAAAAEGEKALRESQYVILTLGTAWVWELGGMPVANCHKQPASRFIRRRLTAEEATATLDQAIHEHLVNKDVIVTVSPIRHPGDGLPENTRSKAALIEAAHRLAESNPRVEYFPAYEILMDDLRDYRFYERDMVHPSAVAVDYIWEQFCATAMDPATRALAAECAKLTSAAAHRPLHPGTQQYAAFRRAMAAKAAALQKQHPELDLRAEIEYFSA